MFPTGIELVALLVRAEMHAPHLIDIEVVNALRRWESLREMTATDVHKALDVFPGMSIERHPHTDLLGEV
jgi:predicted nucleic acid-binding protein